MAAFGFSSSLLPGGKHDVFISFRGLDTRHGFLSHLKRELQRNKIDVYVDEKLERGEEIEPALLKAIERSMISLVIFSEDYASSRWCLDELVKIMDCRETNRLIVIPVFYKIDPSDVRYQRESYERAFAKHEERFKDNMEKLQIWRSALTKAANLAGIHYSSFFQKESELIDEIIDNILKKKADKDSRKPGYSKLSDDVYQKLTQIGSSINIEPRVQFNKLWGPKNDKGATVGEEKIDSSSTQFRLAVNLNGKDKGRK